MSALFTVKERLYLNEERTKVVRDGDPEAASLYAIPGQEVPISEARRFGLTGEQVTNAEPPPRKNRTVTTASIERR